MSRKSLTVASVLLTAIVSGILIDSYIGVESTAQQFASEPKGSPTKDDSKGRTQKTYPSIKFDAWLNPFADLPLNMPIQIAHPSQTQNLAVLSVDDLIPSPSKTVAIKIPQPQYKLVTLWQKDEVRLYAYEIQKTQSREIIDPLPVNQDLFPISKFTRECKPSPAATELPSGNSTPPVSPRNETVGKPISHRTLPAFKSCSVTPGAPVFGTARVRLYPTDSDSLEDEKLLTGLKINIRTSTVDEDGKKREFHSLFLNFPYHPKTFIESTFILETRYFISTGGKVFFQ